MVALWEQSTVLAKRALLANRITGLHPEWSRQLVEVELEPRVMNNLLWRGGLYRVWRL